MPKRDKAFMKQQRERILDAAYVCFLREGFGETSIRDICEEVDLSIGAVYNHFKNRDAIIKAVCTRISKQTTDATPPDCTVDEFIDYITNVIVECHKDPSMTDLNNRLVAAAFSNELMAELYEELMEISFSWMKKHVKRFRDAKEIDMPFDLDTTVRGVSGVLTGISMRMYFEPPRPDKIVAKQMRSLIAHMIGAPAIASVQRKQMRRTG